MCQAMEFLPCYDPYGFVPVEVPGFPDFTVKPTDCVNVAVICEFDRTVAFVHREESYDPDTGNASEYYELLALDGAQVGYAVHDTVYDAVNEYFGKRFNTGE